MQIVMRNANVPLAVKMIAVSVGILAVAWTICKLIYPLSWVSHSPMGIIALPYVAFAYGVQYQPIGVGLAVFIFLWCILQKDSTSRRYGSVVALLGVAALSVVNPVSTWLTFSLLATSFIFTIASMFSRQTGHIVLSMYIVLVTVAYCLLIFTLASVNQPLNLGR